MIQVKHSNNGKNCTVLITRLKLVLSRESKIEREIYIPDGKQSSAYRQLIFIFTFVAVGDE